MTRLRAHACEGTLSGRYCAEPKKTSSFCIYAHCIEPAHRKTSENLRFFCI
nr:MAG TPA: hypothetical protein [Bacteriophage sp.]